jgi:hypothetical protein
MSPLRRETFRTSRLIEFCNRRELVNQTGHEVADRLGQRDGLTASAISADGEPLTATVHQIVDCTSSTSFAEWLRDRRNSRQIPHHFQECGYVAVRNPHAQDGMWKVGNARMAVYAKDSLSIQEPTPVGQRLRRHTIRMESEGRMSVCRRCGYKITWAAQRAQFGRLIRLGFSSEQAKGMQPRCQTCMTWYLRHGNDDIGAERYAIHRRRYPSETGTGDISADRCSG